MAEDLVPEDLVNAPSSGGTSSERFNRRDFLKIAGLLPLPMAIGSEIGTVSAYAAHHREPATRPPTPHPGAAPTALMLNDPALPEHDPALPAILAGALETAGYSVRSTTIADIFHPHALTVESCALLALPQAQALPPALFPVVHAYLRAGGHLLALGLPAWNTQLVPGSNGTWSKPLAPITTPLPPLETLCPAYKFYPIHGAVRVDVAPGQAVIRPPRERIQAPAAMISSYARPSSTGFAKGRPWRWVSLLRAGDAHSDAWRGSPGTLLLYPPGAAPHAGGAWAAFTPATADFYRQPAMRRVLTQTARRLHDGLFLLEGGAEFYTYFPGQSVRLGTRVANLCAARESAAGQARRGRVAITIQSSDGRKVLRRSWPVVLNRGGTVVHEFTWNPPGNWPAAGYTIITELSEHGRVVDSLEHRLHVWTPPAHPNWVTIRPDGHFYLNGRLWRINGVNYMPSSGPAVEGALFGTIFLGWLNRPGYDPEVIERDLGHIQNIGLNAVSVRCSSYDMDSQNLLDLLRRCREHQLRVKLSLQPGVSYWLNGRSWEQGENLAWHVFKEIIDHYRLAENDTVFTYEIDWEPSFGSVGGLRRTDKAWAKWVQTHYGGIAAAERAWGVPAPRDKQGQLTGPPHRDLDFQLVYPVRYRKPLWTGPSNWADLNLPAVQESQGKLIAAYRRFLNDWLAETYGLPARRIRAIAPHQYVSFRMAQASDPGWINAANYHLEGLARALDFLSPESYGELNRRADPKSIRPATDNGSALILFRVAYARSIAPHEPVIWAETGENAWGAAAQQIGGPQADVLSPLVAPSSRSWYAALQADSPQALQAQGAYYAKFYELALFSGADGIFWWFYPGGYQYYEGSDYGLINPDGTDRPATKMVRIWGRRLLAAPRPPEPTVWLDYDSERHPDGVLGIYWALYARFCAAVKHGCFPGLRAIIRTDSP